MLFLWLYNLASKNSHKATTHDCIPQEVVCGVCSERTVFFLCFYNLASKGCHKAATYNGLDQRVIECVLV